MFIHARAARRFTNEQTGEVFQVANNFIGAAPEWVMHDEYFQACCQDGTITALIDTKDPSIEQAEIEAKARQAAAAETGKQRAEEDGSKSHMLPPPGRGTGAPATGESAKKPAKAKKPAGQ
jgi:hypothetical protein